LQRVVIRCFGRLAEIVDDQCVQRRITFTKPILALQPFAIGAVLRHSLDRLALIFAKRHDALVAHAVSRLLFGIRPSSARARSVTASGRQASSATCSMAARSNRS